VSLRPRGEGLWTLDVPHRVLGLDLGARMTVVRDGAGRLVLVSPIAIDEATAGELHALGQVACVVAPSLMHYRFVPGVRERYPDARVLAAPGLAAKRPALPIDAELDAAEVPGLRQHLVAGMPGLNEVAFLHPPSRTLILTDLLFNFPTAEGWLLRTYLRLGRAYGGPAQTLLLRAMVKDRAALARSRDELLAWDFDRIVVAHGEVLEHGGPQALRQALAWV
jgi:hypothetical protein